MAENAYRVKYSAYRLHDRIYITPDLNIDRKYWGEDVWANSSLEYEDMALFRLFAYIDGSLDCKQEGDRQRRELLPERQTMMDLLPPEQQPIMDFILQVLGNRKLTLPELLSSIRSYAQNERREQQLSRMWLVGLQILYLQNSIHVQPAIQQDRNGRLFCLRCLHSDGIEEYECAACREQCYRCTHCLIYGEVRSCTPMLEARWFPTRPLGRNVEIVYPHPLTKEQERASRQIAEHIIQKKNVLVWAVCGSGKTELIFEAIARLYTSVPLTDVSATEAEAVSLWNRKVMIATPRKDVVFELLPRLKSAFPGLTVHAVYGGSREKHRAADITIATTHQLLRYRDGAFDLVVIDETDAFPYAGDKELAEHAHRIGKQFIYMTATPDLTLLKRIKKQQLSAVTLFHRHHRHPLPEPVNLHFTGIEAKGFDLLWEKVKGSKSKLSSRLKQIIEQLPRSGVVMFFVPTVASGKVLLHSLRMYLTYEGKSRKDKVEVEFVHAQDPQREKKIADLRAGRYQWIVTTTVLERGVTIPNSHVIVVDAQHQVFTKSTLVQIAGRVGRTVEYPTGSVIFLSRYTCKQVVLAMKEIRSLNQWSEAVHEWK